MIKDGVKNREAVKLTLDRGLVALTGATDPTEAWRSFFEPGDVVGIKMNPVGNPLANSSSELMLEVIDGLKSAGVKPKDMIVFERYRDEFIGAKMHEAVPDGVALGRPRRRVTTTQPARLGDQVRPATIRVAGYDPDEFMTMDLVHGGTTPRTTATSGRTWASSSPAG